MTHADAKLMLARAESHEDRKQAVAKAIESGMSLAEIEEYLDWTDAVRRTRVPAPVQPPRSILRSLLQRFRRNPAG